MIPEDMPFIELIGWACMLGGLAAILGGVVLAVVESRMNERVSSGITDLGNIARALEKKNDQEPATSLAKALTNTAAAFTEFVRASRSPAKSIPAFRVGVILFFVAGGLAVVDHSVAPKNAPAPTSTSTSTTASTSTTTTRPPATT